MNKYIKMFMDDNNLKEGEIFKIKYFDNEFWFDYYGYLNSKIKDDYNNLTCMLLSGDVQVEKEPWKPKKGERYYFNDEYGDVVWNTYGDDDYDRYVLAHRLVFQTQAEAEDYKWFLDKVDEYKKPFGVCDKNYYFNYDHDGREVIRYYDDLCQCQGTIYFGSLENIDKFLEEVGEDRIKKYWFKVED